MNDAGSRKVDRKHVLLNATIISPDGTQLARICDLSASGAQISCSKPPLLDADVIFKRGAVFVAARVAWTKKTQVRLEFYRPVDPGVMRGPLQQ